MAQRGRSRKRGTIFDLDLGERIGKTPAQWLAWIIRFTQTDLATLRPEERIALAKDLTIFPFITTQPYPTHGVTIDDTPIPDAMLTAIHDELRQGLRELMTKSGEWIVPGLKRFRLLRVTPRGSSITWFLARWDAGGDARSAVLGAVAGLLVKYGHKVRACPKCRKVFVAQGRQVFCSVPCGNRVRVAQFRAKQNKDHELKAEVLAQRRALYAKKMKGKLGAGVKVGKRA